MNRIIISTFLIINIIYGINPPQNGNFPDGFWEKMEQQNIGQKYGDPGWVKKISNYIQPRLLSNVNSITFNSIIKKEITQISKYNY